MARRVAAELTLDAGPYLAEARLVESRTAAVDRQMAELDRETDKVDRSMAELAVTSKVAGHEVDNLGSRSHSARDALRLLDAKLAATRLSVRQLGIEFARTGDEIDGRNLSKERSLLARLERLRRELEKPLSAGGTLLPGGGGGVATGAGGGAAGIGALSLTNPYVLGGLASVVALALPAIGAAVSGAVVGTVAGGGVIGGIWAASHDERVAQAAMDLQSVFTKEAFGSEAFVGPTIDALHLLKATFRELDIGDTLAKGASSVRILAEGVASLVRNLMPGFNVVMDHAAEYTAVFSQGLAGTGTSISYFLKQLVASKGTIEGLNYAFKILEAVIGGTGDALRFLGDSFDWAVRTGQHFTDVVRGLLIGLGSALPGLRPIFKPTLDFLDKLSVWVADITHTGPSVGQVVAGIAAEFVKAHKGFYQLGQDAQNAANAIEHLNGQLYDFQGFQISAAAAADRIHEDMINLTTSVQDNGTTLDVNTAAGLANRGMIRDLMEDLRNLREKNINAGMSVSDANTQFTDQANILQNKLIVQLGFASAAVADLFGQFKNLPPVITTEFVLKYEEQGFPAGEHSGLRFGETYARASGGPVIPGMPYRINERGSETVTFPAAGMVHPANLSPVGMAPVNLTVQLVDSTTGAVTRQVLITDALNRNQPASVVAAAYP